jgi:hypothetical protein
MHFCLGFLFLVRQTRWLLRLAFCFYFFALNSSFSSFMLVCLRCAPLPLVDLCVWPRICCCQVWLCLHACVLLSQHMRHTLSSLLVFLLLLVLHRYRCSRCCVGAASRVSVFEHREFAIGLHLVLQQAPVFRRLFGCILSILLVPCLLNFMAYPDLEPFYLSRSATTRCRE